jgi:two-component system nitrogen regulation sensor histidine kinase NtrY
MKRAWRSLRTRLLAAFVLVAVPPVVVLAVIITSNVTRTLETNAAGRLDHGLLVVSARVAALRERAARSVDIIAHQRLPSMSVENDAHLVDPGQLDRDLPVLEIVDSSGVVVASRHWPVSFGLPDQDWAFPGDASLRWQKVAYGYGYVERLTVTASRETTLRGRSVTVRGGFFLDGDLLPELSGPLGMSVGLYDANRNLWIVPREDELTEWKMPRLDRQQGEISLAGSRYQWRSRSLHASLWIVVAVPATDLGRLVNDVRRLASFIAIGALLAALIVSVWLSGRISRPVRKLANAARHLASGDPPEPVSAVGSSEIAELATAFNHLAGELHESRERLLQAERVAAWREMARRVAHELKNPLFPIQLSIETLQKAFEKDAAIRSAGEFPQLFRESCKTLLDELRVLRGIIDEFSDFARLPHPSLRPVDIDRLVTQIISLYQSRAGDVSIDLALDPLAPQVLADRDLLSRALSNLIANALEAMPQGGVLRIETAVQADFVTIEISDTGPGLTEDQRTRLFTPYYTTKKGGTGLGLAITQSIVSDHGGRIEVRSEPGQGTTFILRLRSLRGIPKSPPPETGPIGTPAAS